MTFELIQTFLCYIKGLHRVVIAMVIFGMILVTAFLTMTVLSQYVMPGIAFVFGWISFAFGLECLWDIEDAEGLAARRISIRLMWKHQIQFCGFYRAQGKRLELRPGGTPLGLDPISCVINGIDDFGVTTAVELIHRFHSDPSFIEKQIVPCLVVFRKSPVVVIAKREYPLSTDGLNGARIAFGGRSDSTYREFATLAARARVTYVPVFMEDVASLSDPLRVLANDGAEYRVGYAFNEALYGEIDEYNRFHSKFLGLICPSEMYADVLFTQYSNLKQLGVYDKTVFEMIHRVRDGFAECVRNDHSGVWDILKHNCHEQCTYFEAAKRERSIDLVSRSLEIMKDCLYGVDPNEPLIGVKRIWQVMERDYLICRSSPPHEREKQYWEFVEKKGLFELH